MHAGPRAAHNETMAHLVALTAALLTLVTATAAAEPEPDLAGPMPDLTPRVEVGVTGLAGVADIRGVWVGTFGGALSAGARWDRLAALAEYRLLDMDDTPCAHLTPTCTTPARSGLAQRAGLAARYSLLRAPVRYHRRGAPSGATVRADLWLELGAGHTWGALGDTSLSRDDVELGIAFAVGSRSDDAHRAFALGVRAGLARPSGGGPAEPSWLLSVGGAFGS